MTGHRRAINNAIRRIESIPKQIAKAQDRAIKRAAQQTKTRVSAVVRDAVPLKKVYVDERVKVTITDVADGTKQAVISSRKRGLLLSRLPYRKLGSGPKGRGIQVQTTKGKKTTFSHAFLVPLRAGREQGDNIGIAVRKGPDYKRYPIDVLHGLSISQIYAHQLPNLKREAADLYRKAMQQQLNYVLRAER